MEYEIDLLFAFFYTLKENLMEYGIDLLIVFLIAFIGGYVAARIDEWHRKGD